MTIAILLRRVLHTADESHPHMAAVPYNLNNFFGNGTAYSQGTITVRAEEALIVVLVLALWIAAIALFFNRWGKIRMLEPYQPKFIQQHRPSCPLVDQSLIQRRSFSKFNMNGDAFGGHLKAARTRQNSLGSSMLGLELNGPRKVKSAFDLQTLVFSDPALNKNCMKMKSEKSSSRRTSLFPNWSRKATLVSRQCEQSEESAERRLSFKDLVDMERNQRNEKVQCLSERGTAEYEISGRTRKLSDVKRISSVPNQSSLTDSRHNSISNIGFPYKFSAAERRNSTLPSQRDLSPSLRETEAGDLRFDVKSGVSGFRRNSMLLANYLEHDGAIFNPLGHRESFKSGVIDFRRNSMLIINNLTEDIGLKPFHRDLVLGGSDFSVGGRRNSVMLPCVHETVLKFINTHSFQTKTKPIPVLKSTPIHSVENKYIANRKPSKSLDCGEPITKIASTRKKEASQPSLLTEFNHQSLKPVALRNLAESSASLNAYFARAEAKSIQPTQSTADINLELANLKISHDSAKITNASHGTDSHRSDNHDKGRSVLIAAHEDAGTRQPYNADHSPCQSPTASPAAEPNVTKTLSSHELRHHRPSH